MKDLANFGLALVILAIIAAAVAIGWSWGSKRMA